MVGRGHAAAEFARAIWEPSSIRARRFPSLKSSQNPQNRHSKCLENGYSAFGLIFALFDALEARERSRATGHGVVLRAEAVHGCRRRDPSSIRGEKTGSRVPGWLQRSSCQSGTAALEIKWQTHLFLRGRWSESLKRLRRRSIPGRKLR